MQRRALEVTKEYQKFDELHGKKIWSKQDYIKGLVGDVGDLLQASMAKDGVRQIPDADSSFQHEIGDCILGICVVAGLYDVDLEQAFMKSVDGLHERTQSE